LKQKAEYLWSHGEFFSSKQLDNCKYVFYTLHDYYIVVKLEKEEITSIHPFTKGKYLEYMLEQVIINI
jgi:hypothetical protein